MRPLLLLLATLAATLTATAQVPTYVPTDGLVAWYPFNGNANDESGNDNNGSVNGASITSDRDGNQSAFHFNGNGDQINIPYSSSLSPTEEVSVSAWCRAETFEGKNLVANGTHVNFYHRSYYLFGPDANGLCRFRLHAGTTEESVYTSTSFDLSEWVHLVGTYDGSSMRIYANGTLEGELLKSGAINQHGNGTTIGSNIFYAYSDYWFQGDIDDVGIWNRALTATEVQTLYLSASPQTGCTDSSACNYDSAADEDDGSCTYPPAISVDGMAVIDTIFAQLNQTLVFESDSPAEADSTLLDEFSVFFNAYSAYSLPVLESGTDYRLIATGRYGFADGWSHNDAAFSYRWDIETGTRAYCNGTQDAQVDIRWLYDGATNFQRPDNDTDNNAQFCSGVDKTYYWTLPGDGNSHTVGFLDGGGYGDNSGELSFKLYELSSAAGFTWPDGSTGASWSFEATATGTFDFALSDGSCSTNMVIVVDDTGCTDATACNYDADAISDDGSCDYTCCPGPGCCDDPSQWDAALQQCNTAAPDTIVVTDTLLVPTPFCGAGTHWDPVTEMCIADAPGIVDENCTVMNLQELAEGYQVLLDHTADQDSIILAQQAVIDSMNALPPCSCSEPILYQGYSYDVVQVGDQCWFAENLRSESYRNGDPIPNYEADGDWFSAHQGSEGAWCHPNGDASKSDSYGHLYNHWLIMDGREVCPEGWHVPSDADFIELEMFMGMSLETALLTDWRGSDQGTRLKASPASVVPWDGTDEVGFRWVQGGWRHVSGSYGYVDDLGLLMFTPSAESGGAAYGIRQAGNQYQPGGLVRSFGGNAGDGRNLRCLKN